MRHLLRSVGWLLLPLLANAAQVPYYPPPGTAYDFTTHAITLTNTSAAPAGIIFPGPQQSTTATVPIVPALAPSSQASDPFFLITGVGTTSTPSTTCKFNGCFLDTGVGDLIYESTFTAPTWDLAMSDNTAGNFAQFGINQRGVGNAAGIYFSWDTNTTTSCLDGANALPVPNPIFVGPCASITAIKSTANRYPIVTTLSIPGGQSLNAWDLEGNTTFGAVGLTTPVKWVNATSTGTSQASVTLGDTNSASTTTLQASNVSHIMTTGLHSFTGAITDTVGGTDAFKVCTANGNIITGTTACGATPSTAINGAIYSVTSANSGAQPFFGRNASNGTSAIAFMELGNDTVTLETGLWNTSTTFVGTVSGAGQSGPTQGLFFNQPFWVAAGSHPTIGITMAGNVSTAAPTSGVTSTTTGLSGTTVQFVTNNGAELANAATFAMSIKSAGDGLRIHAGSGTQGPLVVTNAADTTNLWIVHADGNLFAPALATSSGATNGTLCWRSSDGLINVDTTTTCLLSSRRYKKDITPLNEGLAAVQRLRPVSYRLKEDPYGTGPQIGLIAEEVDVVDARLVSHDPDGSAHAVRYQQLTALLIKAIQEQQHEIDKLKRQVQHRGTQ